MNQLLATALKMMSLDIACLPIKPMSKKAAISWEGYQQQKPTISDYCGWFNRDDLNIAVLCGPVSNNLVVLDFDVLPTYHQAILEYPILLDSFTVQTTRGCHVYLFVDELPAKTFKAEGIDVKVSGYCLCPPSVHPSGSPYEILKDCEIKRIDNLLEVGIGGATPHTPPSPVCGSASPRITINNYGTLNITGGVIGANTHHCTRLGGLGGETPHNLIDTIKNQIPITRFFTPVKVSADNRGWAHCPGKAHKNGDRDPSLSLDLNTNRFRCTSQPSCEFYLPRGGDVIDAYRIIHNLSFKEAVNELAQQL